MSEAKGIVNEKNTKIIHVNITIEKHNKIVELSKKMGLTPTTLTRMCLYEMLERKRNET